MTQDEMKERLAEWLSARGHGVKKELAVHVFGGEEHQTKISRMLPDSAEPRRIGIEEWPRIVEFFEESVAAKKTMPIVGRVGASTDGAIIQDTGDQGQFGHIEVPAGANGGEVAVEVRGHSMGIYAPDGSVIIYDDRHDPPTDDLLGEVCVVGLPDGRVLAKRLLRGSRKGLFDLESLVGETMRDQRVEWAAVVALVVHPRRARLLRVV